jgi:hypothetical protein
MLAPGVPTAVAHDIAENLHAPDKMAKDVVDTTMDTHYGTRHDGFTPAAAFDVIDLDPKKTAAVASAVTNLDAALVHEAANNRSRCTGYPPSAMTTVTACSPRRIVERAST